MLYTRIHSLHKEAIRRYISQIFPVFFRVLIQVAPFFLMYSNSWLDLKHCEIICNCSNKFDGERDYGERDDEEKKIGGGHDQWELEYTAIQVKARKNIHGKKPERSRKKWNVRVFVSFYVNKLTFGCRLFASPEMLKSCHSACACATFPYLMKVRYTANEQHVSTIRRINWMNRLQLQLKHLHSNLTVCP